jgi:hypothetical protein
MTISKWQQTDDIDKALRMILYIVGEAHLNGALFLPDDEPFRDILATTWD